MEESEIWEGAKTSALMIGGLIVALTVLVALDRIGFVEPGIVFDTSLLIQFIGLLMALSIGIYFLDRLKW